MREQDREQQQRQDWRQLRQGEGCLDVLIHEYGHEHINNLAELISLTTSVENSIQHSSMPYR